MSLLEYSPEFKNDYYLETFPSSSTTVEQFFDLQTEIFFEQQNVIDLKTSKSLKPIASGSACPEFCAVCGDKATGYHYDAPSCNGCKAFFRRTVISGKKFTCKFNGDCEFRKDVRCACRACRFQKCLRAGMDGSLIEVPLKTNKNTSKRKGSLVVARAEEERPAKMNFDSITSHECLEARLLGSLNYLQIKLDRLRGSSFSPNNLNISLAEVLMRSNNELDNPEKYEIPQDWPRAQPPPCDFLKRRKFIEQHRPFRDGTSKKCNGQRNGFKKWFWCDLFIPVEYARTFNFFQDLCREDKENLLKSVAVVNCAIMQAYYSYEQKSDTVIYPDGIKPLLWWSNPPVLEIEIHKKVMEPLIRSQFDKNEYVLLKVIAFTNAGCVKLTKEGRERLQNEQNTYAGILLKYMQNRYGSALGAQKFAEAISCLEAFIRNGNKRRENYAYWTAVCGRRKAKFIEELLS